MEVHHHPHVEKKKFKEYFLEFLMIFLAVTMGFFAETIRENITEHRHAREFALLLLKDVEQDTVQLNSYRQYFSYVADNIDTLIQLLANNDPKDITTGKLYWYGLFGGARRSFVPNDETFQQMKSSGSLRYFGQKIASAAAKYDRFCRLMQSYEQIQQNIYAEVRKLRAQIFIVSYNDRANNIFQKYFKSWGNFDFGPIDSFMKTNPPVLSYDKTLFNEYIELVRSRFIRGYNVGGSDSLLHQASVLISELKTEYRLEDK
ncbi:MAG TPA: hypothetical protein VK588_13630 [Chitinophagaceae bacterium]|nr:hypothetical protein [Chitinophagaceae bacterium]